MEEAAEDYDDHGLDDEQCDGARRVVLGGIAALEDTGLGGRAVSITAAA